MLCIFAFITRIFGSQVESEISHLHTSHEDNDGNNICILNKRKLPHQKHYYIFKKYSNFISLVHLHFWISSQAHLSCWHIKGFKCLCFKGTFRKLTHCEVCMDIDEYLENVSITKYTKTFLTAIWDRMNETIPKMCFRKSL